jgi:DnaJ-domain-containing protein 1
MSLTETVARHFQDIQLGILVFSVISIGIFFRARSEPSRFRQREADRPDLDRILKQGPDSGQSRGPKKGGPSPAPPPLFLPGIRLNGAPHEVLGVDENATEPQVMKAYKEAIKRFHPDTIQGKAREQLKFYEDASARINDAKNEMLRKIRS